MKRPRLNASLSIICSVAILCLASCNDGGRRRASQTDYDLAGAVDVAAVAVAFSDQLHSAATMEELLDKLDVSARAPSVAIHRDAAGHPYLVAVKTGSVIYANSDLEKWRDRERSRDAVAVYTEYWNGNEKLMFGKTFALEHFAGPATRCAALFRKGDHYYPNAEKGTSRTSLIIDKPASRSGLR